jgi:hypothetical protein
MSEKAFSSKVAPGWHTALRLLELVALAYKLRAVCQPGGDLLQQPVQQ